MARKSKYPPIKVGDVLGCWTVCGESFQKLRADGTRWLECWPVICSCGSKASHITSYLNQNPQRCKSCPLTHGMSKTRTHRVWRAIKNRCHNPKSDDWELYGGRGIKVCERWCESFENFYEDMGEMPRGYSIERKDVNGHYEPDNCVYIPMLMQGKNKRTTIKVTYNGKSITLRELAVITGVNCATLKFRYHKGYRGGQLVHKGNLKKSGLSHAHLGTKPTN